MNHRVAFLAAAAALLGPACSQGRKECRPSQALCGDVCVNVETDPANCGACGKTCGVGFECQRGADGAPSACGCPVTTTLCGDRCAPTLSDAANCGGCRTSCAAFELCSDGRCVAACPPAKPAVCAGGCVDVASDRQHCGRCGNLCPQGQACVRAACRADLFAACFNSHEVYGLEAASLTSLPAPLAVGNGPQGLAFYKLAGGGEILGVLDGLDSVLYHVEATGTPKLLAGRDPAGAAANQVIVDGTTAWIVNSLDNNVQAIDLARPFPGAAADGGTASRTVKQIPTAVGSPPSAANTNPYLATLVGGKLYVTLLGNCFAGAAGMAAGNRVVEIDPAANGGAGAVTRTYALAAGAELKPPTGQTTYAQPSGIAFANGKLYVALGNATADCFTARGPGFVEVVDVASFTRKALIELGDACVNTFYVLAASDRVYATCTGLYDPQGKGGVAILDAQTDKLVANNPIVLACPTPTGACKQPAPGRAALYKGRLYIGDSGDGRLFVLGADGTVVRGATNPVVVCPAPIGGFQFIADVAAP